MNNYKPISVIIPAYNAERYIGRCLDSIQRIANNQVEVVIINDGSVDKTQEICETYANKYDYINVINQKNLGVSTARNTGIGATSGEYIMFVDADDFLADNTFEWALEKAKYPNTLFVGSYNFLKPRKRIEPFIRADRTINLNDEYIDSVIDAISNAPWGKVYHRDIIEKYNIRFPSHIPYAEDTIFLIEYLKHIDKLQVCSDIIYNYNFTNWGSARFKYYPDFYKYMFDVMDVKKSYCNFHGIKYDTIKDKNRYYKRCVNHYMYNNKSNYIDEITKFYDIKRDATEVKKEWYSQNWNTYIAFRINKILNRK